MALNFASIFPSTNIMTNVLLDLAAAGTSYLQGLREEVERVGASHDQIWNKQTLEELWRVDSAIKESLRMWSPLGYALPRQVKVFITAGLIR